MKQDELWRTLIMRVSAGFLRRRSTQAYDGESRTDLPVEIRPCFTDAVAAGQPLRYRSTFDINETVA